MARDGRFNVLRDIDTLFHVGTVAGLTDAELLERFTARRDQSAELAFSALVERHGPMVLRVCRAVLRDNHDAQDAFQATFLILVRKARAIRHRDSVGSWLHGVALRVASCARSTAARRRRHEQRAAERPGAEAVTVAARDWEPLLQEEIGRLPERFRAAIVLCDLQGLTHEQAASQLGCPVGTIKSRQARGRARLRTRLTHRGLAPMVGVVGGPTIADLPFSLTDSTVRAAARFAASKVGAAGTVSASVATLIEGALMTMMGTKLKIAALLLLATGVVGAGAGVLVGQDRSDPPKQAPNPPAARTPETTKAQEEVSPSKNVRSERELDRQRLRKRIVAAARQRLEAQRAFYEEGRIPLDRYLNASESLMMAETQASENREGRIAAAKAHHERLKEIEKREIEELKVGRGTIADVTESVLRREQAELELLTVSDPEATIEHLSRRLQNIKENLDSASQELETLKREHAQRPRDLPPAAAPR